MSEEKTWAERVETLEAKLAASGDVNAALKEQIVALQANVADAVAAEASRQAAVAADYVGKIKEQACAAGSPIDEDKIAKVEALFAAGSADTARELGDAYLAVSTASGGGDLAASTEKTLVDLGAKTDDGWSDADRAAFASRHNLKGA